MNYSIIIPHKNSQSLLKRCLESIPQRDDVEIIVVDDNSDNIKEVKAVIALFPRATFYANEGVFAGGARNTGLRYAKGERILFIDADDFFHDGFLDVTDKYLHTDIDLVFFDTDSCDSDTLEKVATRCYALSDGVRAKDLEYLRWRVRPCWGKLFRAQYLYDNSISFDEVKASNDVMFSCMSSFYAKTFDINSFTLVCSTVNRDSLCHRMNKESLDARYDVAVRFRRFAYEHRKGKYTSNLLGFMFYYRDISNELFFKMLGKYFKASSLRMVWDDVCKTFDSAVKIIIGKKHSGRKLVEVSCSN